MHINEDFIKTLNAFEEIIGYKFKNKELLVFALTHSSYANEIKNISVKSNERLEFLGDALLNVIISEKLFFDNRDFDEGKLTKIRANIVCESTLAICAKKIKIGDYLILGKGEELSGGRNRISILSDAFESLIGAIYADSDPNEIRDFVLKQMEDIIKEAVKGNIFFDYKTQLQELAQKKGESNISYDLIDEKGPDHNKMFTISVKVNNKLLGTGNGRTKKEAEQNAAKSAIDNL